MTRPVYAVGDLLVLTEFDGRSTNHSFLEVVSLTKVGTPRVYVLGTEREEMGRSASHVDNRVRPTNERRSKVMAMRWYPSVEQYAFERMYGCAYTKLERYDENAIYIDAWLDS